MKRKVNVNLGKHIFVDMHKKQDKQTFLISSTETQEAGKGTGIKRVIFSYSNNNNTITTISGRKTITNTNKNTYLYTLDINSCTITRAHLACLMPRLMKKIKLTTPGRPNW